MSDLNKTPKPQDLDCDERFVDQCAYPKPQDLDCDGADQRDRARAKDKGNYMPQLWQQELVKLMTQKSMLEAIDEENDMSERIGELEEQLAEMVRLNIKLAERLEHVEEYIKELKERAEDIEHRLGDEPTGGAGFQPIQQAPDPAPGYPEREVDNLSRMEYERWRREYQLRQAQIDAERQRTGRTRWPTF